MVIDWTVEAKSWQESDDGNACQLSDVKACGGVEQTNVSRCVVLQRGVRRAELAVLCLVKLVPQG